MERCACSLCLGALADEVHVAVPEIQCEVKLPPMAARAKPREALALSMVARMLENQNNAGDPSTSEVAQVDESSAVGSGRSFEVGYATLSHTRDI